MVFTTCRRSFHGDEMIDRGGSDESELAEKNKKI